MDEFESGLLLFSDLTVQLNPYPELCHSLEERMQLEMELWNLSLILFPTGGKSKPSKGSAKANAAAKATLKGVLFPGLSISPNHY